MTIITLIRNFVTEKVEVAVVVKAHDHAVTQPKTCLNFLVSQATTNSMRWH